MMKEEHYWYWLCNIPGIGRKTILRLVGEVGNPVEIYEENDEEIFEIISSYSRKSCFEEYIRSKNEAIIIQGYERLINNGISFIYPESDTFPEKLKNIPDPPACLYLKGRMFSEDACVVAIIGARNSTHYGREMARFFGRELSKEGIVVVSGLARGIDGMAHRGAIEAGSYTLGVLGCGIDVVYPEENYDLYMAMEKHGGIISESNMGIKPCSALFPQRNRIISGLADGILVIEATKKSGTFITVDQGLEQGKEIFALPGRILDENSGGCNALIKMGAHLVTDVSDILEILCGITTTNNILSKRIKSLDVNREKNLLAPAEKIVYSVLSVEPKYIDEIIRETRLSPGDVCMYINKLYMSGYIIEPARNYYSIKI